MSHRAREEQLFKMMNGMVVVVAAMTVVGLVVGSPIRGKAEPVTTVASVVLKAGSGFEIKMGENLMLAHACCNFIKLIIFVMIKSEESEIC